MSWQSIDLFFVEAWEFSDELWGVVWPIFEGGRKVVADWEKQHETSRKEMLEQATEDHEVQDARTLAYLEEQRIDQRSQAIGAAVLHCAYEIFKDRLRGISRWFDKSHPGIGGYQGRSEIHRLAAEYLGRFGVDFEKSPFFSGIRELALARNAGIHSDVQTYLAEVPNPRFMKNGGFSVEETALKEVLNETDSFVGWVVSELSAIRKARPGMN